METYNSDGFVEYSAGGGLENLSIVKVGSERESSEEFNHSNEWTIIDPDNVALSDILIERKPVYEGSEGYLFRAQNIDGKLLAAKMAVGPEGDKLQKEAAFLQRFNSDMFPRVIGFTKGTAHFDSLDVSKDDPPGSMMRIDFLLKNGVSVMFMEFMDGKSLNGKFLDGNEDVIYSQAESIISGLGGVIDYLAEQGIFHRDISANNVILTEKGVKLIDFGIAVPLVEPMEDGLLPGGEGSSSHFPPESRESDKVTIASETFCLAFLAYQIVSGGSSPYGNKPIINQYGSEDYAVLPRLWKTKGIIETPYESLEGRDFAKSKFSDEQITKLDIVFKRALSIDPKDRYQSGRELADTILAVMKQANS